MLAFVDNFLYRVLPVGLNIDARRNHHNNASRFDSTIYKISDKLIWMTRKIRTETNEFILIYFSYKMSSE